ncbi:MAG: universal stress protein [Flavobacteriales bacterium]|nr:MAG: universal stress protein [Flavobacteriales bacterium]
MKNIIAAIDFSPVTERVITHAAAVAKAMGAKLWIIYVAAPEPDFVGFSTGPQYIRDHLAGQLRKEHAALQDLATAQEGTGLDAEALMVQGPTAETIITEAERLHADLVVMGSHGHGALFRAFVGSVSQSVLQAGGLPVLVIPSELQAE